MDRRAFGPLRLSSGARRVTPTYHPPMPLTDQLFGTFLDDVAAKTPAPGGGAVVGAVGALAAALAGMVVSYSVGKKSLAEHQPELEASVALLARARALMLTLVEEDQSAYALMNELQRLPPEDPRRAAQLPGVAVAATQVPLMVMAAGTDLLRHFERLASISNRFLRSDLAIAGVLAEAVVRAGAWNVRINLPLLAELGVMKDQAAEADRLVATARECAARLEAACV